MGEITTIGVDIAKHVFQLHGVDVSGEVVLCRRLPRGRVAAFFAALPPCLIGIEACGTAHFWAREIAAFGHDVRLMPPGYVKPYVKRNKHDAADAEAVCEAVRRPSMRFVPVKTPEQQAALVSHGVRDLLVRHRTMLVNAMRGHLAELGVVAPRGVHKVEELIIAINDESDERIPSTARRALRVSSPLNSSRSICGSLRSRRRSVPEPKRTLCPSVLRQSPESVHSSHRVSRPRFRTLRSSDRAATSPPGSGSCHDKTRPAERPVLAASPNAVTALSGACSSVAPWRRSSVRKPYGPIPGSASSAPVSQ